MPLLLPGLVGLAVLGLAVLVPAAQAGEITGAGGPLSLGTAFATLTYRIGGQRQTLTDATYPYEFTVPLPTGTTAFDFEVQGVTPDGQTKSSAAAALRR